MQTADLSIEKLLEINREQAARIDQLELMLDKLTMVPDLKNEAILFLQSN